MTDWWRSWHGAPTNNKWLVVARRAGVPPAIVSAIVWAMLDRASQSSPRGCVAGFDTEAYAMWAGLEEVQVLNVQRALIEKGLLDENHCFTNWAQHQPFREDVTAIERKRRQRKKNGHDVSRDVTHGHAPSDTVTTDSDSDSDSEKKESTEEEHARERAHETSSSIFLLKRGWRPSAEAWERARDLGFTDPDLEVILAEHIQWCQHKTGPWFEKTEQGWDDCFVERSAHIASRKGDLSHGRVRKTGRRNGPSVADRFVEWCRAKEAENALGGEGHEASVSG